MSTSKLQEALQALQDYQRTRTTQTKVNLPRGWEIKSSPLGAQSITSGWSTKAAPVDTATLTRERLEQEARFREYARETEAYKERRRRRILADVRRILNR